MRLKVTRKGSALMKDENFVHNLPFKMIMMVTMKLSESYLRSISVVFKDKRERWNVLSLH